MKLLASGAIGVTIKCAAKTKTYLPDILDLKGKVIKFIDVVDNLLYTDVDGNSLVNSCSGLYFNLMQPDTNTLFAKNCSLTKYSFLGRKGKRDSILRVIDFPNSFIENKNDRAINAFVVFWYDDPNVSNTYNENDHYNIDSIDVKKFDNEKKVLFGENRTMYNKQIRSISCVCPDNIYHFVTANGNVAHTQEVAKAFITLQRNNYQFFRNVPAILVSDYVKAYDKIYLQNVTFDFTNSFITSKDPLTGAIMINIEYK